MVWIVNVYAGIVNKTRLTAFQTDLSKTPCLGRRRSRQVCRHPCSSMSVCASFKMGIPVPQSQNSRSDEGCTWHGPVFWSRLGPMAGGSRGPSKARPGNDPWRPLPALSVASMGHPGEPQTPCAGRHQPRPAHGRPFQCEGVRAGQVSQDMRPTPSPAASTGQAGKRARPRERTASPAR